MATLTAPAQSGQSRMDRVSPLARRLAQESGPVGQVFTRLLAQPHAVLVQILFANNLANVALTAVAAVLLDRAFDRFALPEWALIVGETLGLTAFLLVVCELTPKTFAFEKNETVAPVLARVYALLSTPPNATLTTTKPDTPTKPGFYVGGNIYSDWASVPASYKEVNPQPPDPQRSTASIFRFSW